MKLKRRDFESLARIIKKQSSYNKQTKEVAAIALELADYIAEHSANFDKDKFLSQCGVSGEVIGQYNVQHAA